MALTVSEHVLSFARLAHRSRENIEVIQATRIEDLPQNLQESLRASQSAITLARYSPQELGEALSFLHPSGFTGGLRDAVLVLVRRIIDIGFASTPAAESSSRVSAACADQDSSSVN